MRLREGFFGDEGDNDVGAAAISPFDLTVAVQALGAVAHDDKSVVIAAFCIIRHAAAIISNG